MARFIRALRVDKRPTGYDPKAYRGVLAAALSLISFACFSPMRTHGLTIDGNLIVASGNSPVTWIQEVVLQGGSTNKIVYGDLVIAAALSGSQPSPGPSGPASPAQMISVPRSPRDFGNVYAGSYRTQGFLVMNRGAGDLLVQRISLSGDPDFQVSRDGCSGRILGPNRYCTGQVTFRPSSAGKKLGTLIIASNDPQVPEMIVPLSGGIGDASGIPRMSIYGAVNDFGDVTPGRMKIYGFAVGNSGTGSLLIGDLRLTGDSDFSIYSNGCSGRALWGAARCFVSVKLSPLSEGQKNAHLQIASNDLDAPITDISFSGRGFVPRPDISVTPSSYDFGVQGPGAGELVYISVTNKGTADLSITGVSLSNATDFRLNADYCSGKTLRNWSQSHDMCSVAVETHPSSPGLKKSTLYIDSNDPDSPRVDIALSLRAPDGLLYADDPALAVGVEWVNTFQNHWATAGMYRDDKAVGFYNALIAAGALGRFNYGDTTAIKPSTSHWTDKGWGQDEQYVEQVDIAYVASHGGILDRGIGGVDNWRFSYFFAGWADPRIEPINGSSSWRLGDIDTEFAVFDTCYGAQKRWQGFDNVFKSLWFQLAQPAVKLHAVMGYDGFSYETVLLKNHGRHFAEYMTGYRKMAVGPAWIQSNRDENGGRPLYVCNGKYRYADPGVITKGYDYDDALVRFQYDHLDPRFGITYPDAEGGTYLLWMGYEDDELANLVDAANAATEGIHQLLMDAQALEAQNWEGARQLAGLLRFTVIRKAEMASILLADARQASCAIEEGESQEETHLGTFATFYEAFNDMTGADDFLALGTDAMELMKQAAPYYYDGFQELVSLSAGLKGELHLHDAGGWLDYGIICSTTGGCGTSAKIDLGIMEAGGKTNASGGIDWFVTTELGDGTNITHYSNGNVKFTTPYGSVLGDNVATTIPLGQITAPIPHTYGSAQVTIKGGLEVKAFPSEVAQMERQLATIIFGDPAAATPENFEYRDGYIIPRRDFVQVLDADGSGGVVVNNVPASQFESWLENLRANNPAVYDRWRENLCANGVGCP